MCEQCQQDRLHFCLSALRRGKSVLRHSSSCLFFSLCICAAFLSVWAQGPASEVPRGVGTINNVVVSQKTNAIEIEVTATAPFLPQGVRLTSPDRLVFDFPGYGLSGSGRHIAVELGPVKAVRVSLFQLQPPITRVVVDLRKSAEFQVKPSGNGALIDISLTEPESPSVAHPALKENASATPAPLNQPEPRDLPQHPLSRVSAYALQARARSLKLEDLQTLEQRAQAGDEEAETTLALAYHDAVLLKRDDTEALRLLHAAADQGFMAAQESLGIFLQMGIGMPRPAPEEALNWYRKAAEQGSMDAATNIALMYSSGIGVEKDPVQALTWFRRSAEEGDATAQYNLALIYAQGKGVAKDYKESVHWLTLAADQNVLPAVLDLATFYLQPPDGESADLDRAVRYYEIAAELGSTDAEATLGNIFASEALGKPDYEQAVRWYRKAADQGQPVGEFGLGIRYKLGQGVPQNFQDARRLFEAASERGLADAQYELGTIWEEGKGESPDPLMAEHYFQLAAEQGNAKAQFRLGRLLAAKAQLHADRISAYKWLMLAQSVPEDAAALSSLRKTMSAEEVAEGDHAVDDWRISHSHARR